MQASLFDDTQETTKYRKKREKHVSSGWEFTDHACRHCLGRIVKRQNANGTHVVRCAECGKSATGEHSALCWCGAEVSGHGHIFECFRNPNVSAATPQEVLVREKPIVSSPDRAQIRKSNPVKINGYQ